MPASHAFVDQVGQLVDVHEGQRAPPGDRVHTLEVPNALREHSADNFAPFDLRVPPHLPMQVRREGEGDVRHGRIMCAHINELCAHDGFPEFDAM